MAVLAERHPRVDTLVRVTQVVVGLIEVGVSIEVLANPFVPLGTLIVLLAIIVAADGVRLLVTGGPILASWHWVTKDLGSTLRWARGLGRIVIGIVAILLVIAVLVIPQLREATLLYLLAAAVVFLSVDRLAHAFGRESSRFLRTTAAATAAIAILLVIVALTYPSIGFATFAVLLAVALLLGGVQTILAGLRPTDPRQIVLLKLVLFSLFYGLVLINWIDLFGKSAPAYGIWLILTYFAPFWVMLIYEGISEWPLALSLGLLVSLANDVGYYFIGNLLFGFHKNLVVWISGQLGFDGNQVVTFFQGGTFTITVDSWMMGLSIYLRAMIVALGLYYWWVHPARIVARIPTPPAVGV